jgi:hypothetical protein
MAEIVNLNRARKAKAREDAAATAAVNRTAFGRTKAQKAHNAALEAKRQTTLDQARREEP